jgi:hypothetical protein
MTAAQHVSLNHAWTQYSALVWYACCRNCHVRGVQHIAKHTAYWPSASIQCSIPALPATLGNLLCPFSVVLLPLLRGRPCCQQVPEGVHYVYAACTALHEREWLQVYSVTNLLLHCCLYCCLLCRCRADHAASKYLKESIKVPKARDETIGETFGRLTRLTRL